MKLDFIKSLEIFKHANDFELEPITKNSFVKSLDPNQVIISVGDDPKYVYFVMKGKLQVYLDNAEGKKVVLKDLNENDCFGELGVICNATRCANISTKTKAQLLTINGESYKDFYNQNLNASKIIINTLAESLTKITQDYQSLALEKLDHRLIKTLIEISEKTNNNIIVTQTHTQIADRVAATRESVSRALSNLQRRGLVENTNNQIIINEKLLGVYFQI